VNHTHARRAYFTLNAIFTGVILLIMGYSFLFSPEEDSYPVVCIHEKITGEPCPSCGMSHAFSLIVRGRIDEALQWNSYSLRIFLFFVVQLVMRIVLGTRSLITDRWLRQITWIDTMTSSAMALCVFYPFLRMVWLTLF
jgi:hypothetical protein